MIFSKFISFVYNVRCLSTKMEVVQCNHNAMEKYKNAIIALNTLQSNAAYIRSRSYQNSSYEDDYNRTIVHTKKLLAVVGIDESDLNKLSVIHVAGTKGKGSTCAYTESILRRHGYKTGFYSSPHLIEVRERIRIDGDPLSYGKFSEYFWDVFNTLKFANANPLEYFRFLTIMAFKVFIRENVDVAILEVGIGGEFDNTNVVERVPIVGITSLGIDHTTLLGDTIEKIAWHKAGIIKRDSLAFTVPQPIKAMGVLNDRAEAKKVKLRVIEPFLNVPISCPEVNNSNASLAVVLAYSWIKYSGNEMVKSLEGFLESPETLKGLSRVAWPGRYQSINRGKSSYFLDGAHTAESIMICKKWFESRIKGSKAKSKALVFNMIGLRDSEKMLGILMASDFDKVIFVPNVSGVSKSADNQVSDGSYYSDRCHQHKEAWVKLLENNNKKINEKDILILPNVLSAINYLDSGEYNCLITGSLHLMGSTLEVLK